MDSAYLVSPEKALGFFQVTEKDGLSDSQVQQALKKYGRNGTVHHHNPNMLRSLANDAYSPARGPSDSIVAADP